MGDEFRGVEIGKVVDIQIQCYLFTVKLTKIHYNVPA